MSNNLICIRQLNCTFCRQIHSICDLIRVSLTVRSLRLSGKEYQIETNEKMRKRDREEALKYAKNGDLKKRKEKSNGNGTLELPINIYKYDCENFILYAVRFCCFFLFSLVSLLRLDSRRLVDSNKQIILGSRNSK